jgi:hypothetical protein
MPTKDDPRSQAIFRFSKTSQNARLTFAKLQFVKNGSFTGSIETDHQDSHLLLAKLCT